MPRLFPRRPARRVSGPERLLGGLLLLVLAALATLFFHAGSRPGPQPPLDPEPSPAAEPDPSTAQAPLPAASPGGFERGEPREYDADSLFEKINGKADAYLAYDVERLTFASYVDPADPDRWADVYLYDMGAPLNAFGLYRALSGGEEASLEVAEEGRAKGGAAFVRRGPYYVEVTAAGPELAEEARALAVAVADSLPAPDPPVEVPDWFPEVDRGRIRYDLRECMSVEALQNAFLAAYQDGSRAFVSRLASAAEALAAGREAAETFDFLRTAAVIEARGPLVIGVVGAPSPERGAALLAEILGRIESDR